MTRPISSAVNSLVANFSRRNALLWLGGSGITTALMVATQKEVSAKDNKELKLVNPPTLYNAPQNGYSHIAVTPSRARTVYISGQFGSDLQGNLVSDDFEKQLIQAFKNLRYALAAVGAQPQDVAKTTVLIVDHNQNKLIPLGREIINLWGNKPPANTLIPVPRLALDGMLFEIDAYAVIPDNRS
ncbi:MULTISPECIES: RidA family protein [unclassified Nostoc]|uniref:RidA family protein n=1 Tax=unclassified Nostoc TaxID=2593658 RepID=UPI0025AB12AC|nr:MULTISPECIES: RidA family protein [unclassified Nostoc]MDM9584454.1 RidA family protein [Nostoc sp. GT001]MDZ7946418.1 RidA family protein [Nostoc sp. EfeVER01]MDZ7993085.1 RidA family protein [Nostoc sp. EspVER01]